MDILQIFQIKNLDQGAKDIVLAVMVLLKETPDFQTAKKVMVMKNFIFKLKGFDPKVVETVTLNDLKKYTVKLTFNPEWQSNYSEGLRLLCMWVLQTQRDARR